MLIGMKERFAVEWDVCDVVDNWIFFGYFYFWINGMIVGNKDDRSVDLKGCRNWIRDFISIPRDRFEPGLFDLPRHSVFQHLAWSVLVNVGSGKDKSEVYRDTFSRFHISHLGMSSFDAVILLLIKDEIGRERCVWGKKDNNVMEAYFEPNEIESVLEGFNLNS